MATITEMDALAKLDPKLWQDWYERNLVMVSREVKEQVDVNIDFKNQYKVYSYWRCGGISSGQCIQDFVAKYGQSLKDAATVEYARFTLAAATAGVALTAEVTTYCLANPYSCTVAVNQGGDMVLCVTSNTCGTLVRAAGSDQGSGGSP